MMTDLEILARTVWGEAEGEPWETKVAISHVIQNRVDAKSWFGATLGGVCTKAYQFSCWNIGTERRAQMIAVTLDDSAFRDCVAAAAGIVLDLTEDRTNGSTHYYDQSISPPSWTKGHLPTVQLGKLIFFNNIEN